jgi:hypothetical protein
MVQPNKVDFVVRKVRAEAKEGDKRPDGIAWA